MKSPANALSTVQPAMDQPKTLPQVSPTTQPNVKPKPPPKPILKAPPPKMTTKVKIWNLNNILRMKKYKNNEINCFSKKMLNDEILLEVK